MMKKKLEEEKVKQWKYVTVNKKMMVRIMQFIQT